MAYITGIFQGKATGVKVGETKTGKRKVEFNFTLNDKNSEDTKNIEVLLLSEDAEVADDSIVRVEGALQLNLWENNEKVAIISSNVLEVEGETEEGTISGSFTGYPKFVEVGETQNNKRKVTFNLSLSEKTDAGEWVNKNVRTTLLHDEAEVTDGNRVGVVGSLSYNTWETDGEKREGFNLISYDLVS